jgi:glutathione S-transferase
MLALYGKPTSINVRKVLWLCAGLDLPLHHEPAPPADLLATLNPNRQVPVLRDGDFVLGVQQHLPLPGRPRRP